MIPAEPSKVGKMPALQTIFTTEGAEGTEDGRRKGFSAQAGK